LYSPLQILFVAHTEGTAFFPDNKVLVAYRLPFPMCPRDVHRHYFIRILCKSYKSNCNVRQLTLFVDKRDEAFGCCQ